jgi:hypothetical protein
MQRLSQLSSQIAPEIARSSASKAAPTPRLAEHRDTTTSNMAKTKVVVTRQLIDEAQELLDAKKAELEIVQWKSEKVGMTLKQVRLGADYVCSPVIEDGFSRTPKARLVYL